MANISPSKLTMRLEKHKIFEALNSIEELCIFMQFHVFAVWDFMSLLKELQSKISPHGSPWFPKRNSHVVRLINEIVLEEESDIAHPDTENEYTSHFEMYLMAMEEIGASTAEIRTFIAAVEFHGIEYVLTKRLAPAEVQNFLKSTFDAIRYGAVHEIAACFAYGRENLVPVMFSKILETCKVGPEKAPQFHFYLHRHAHLDGEQHGPMAEQLVLFLTENDPKKLREVKIAAHNSIIARLDLWDSVLAAMPNSCNFS